MSSYGQVRDWVTVSVVAAANGMTAATTALTGLQDELDGCSSSPWWSGDAASAASREHAALTERLRRLVAQTAAVRNALDETGDSVLALHREIGSTATFAASWQFAIGDDGSVRDNAPTPAAPTSAEEAAAADQQHTQRMRAQAEIVDRIEQIMRTATDVDADLTAVLKAAVADEIDDGAGTGLAGAQDAGAAAVGLTPQGPPPSANPADNSAWWNTLSEARQAAMLTEHPEWIGNLDGIPAGVRSEANTARLPGIEADLAAQADALRAKLGQDPGRYETRQLREQLAAVVAKQDSLTAITDVMNKGGRQLLLVDVSGDRAMAAIAVGDVDTADHVSVFTPGFNSKVDGSLEGYDTNTALLQQRTKAQLDKFGGGSVAAVTWIGYQPPGGDFAPNISSLDPDNLANAYPVADDDVARAGAASLSSFFNGIDSSRDVDAHLTALGHSYGSLTTSLALQNGTGVDDAVLFGSPGFGTNNVADLGLPAGHVYLEEAHADLVADLGGFGRDPSTLAGVTSLATDARTLPDGSLGAASSGHSEYTDQGMAQGDDGYRRTTATYNMAAVVAGMPERAVGGLDGDRGDEIRAGIQADQDLLSGVNQGLGDPARFVGPSVGPFVDFHLGAAHRAFDLGERGLDFGLDRGDDVRAGVDAAQDWATDRADDLHNAADTTKDWARDRASDVGEGVRDVAGQVGGAAGDVADEVEDTVTDLGRGVLNLADNPPWSR